ncbi:hypothetical protein L1049_016768 [Liquidambar formosana]|uniref:Cellulose synthase-like protein G2 n=1 Tax=Liquidambar formosana TaxID=63359 RepID=A0AAP0S6K7_LIQFO
MASSLPLHLSTPKKSSIIINRSHSFVHSVALLAMIYYRASFFLYNSSAMATPMFPWLMVFASELVLSFLWLLGQAYRWRPISRTIFPERLPEEKELPAIDVFICTADPKKEPAVGVMNTVLSAMALDYPPEKLFVYLSDDGGSSSTLYAVREAWGFAKLWIPFCRRYRIKCRGPKAYFSVLEVDQGEFNSIEFAEEREKIKREYELFKERVTRAREDGVKDTSLMIGQNHPPVIEVINDSTFNDAVGTTDQAEMPLLIYVSREKNPSYPHNFKAGALNALLRVSSVKSNSPYILVLDCDMYCNDPTSAKQAMCFHLDPKRPPSLAFVQFPQRFHNVSNSDIYDGQLRTIFQVMWPGMDGLRGPLVSGTCFYMRREILYGIATQKVMDLIQLQQSFGSSNEFIKSLHQRYQQNVINKGDLSGNIFRKQAELLASCSYEKNTQWGKQIGFMYGSVVEDFFTGFILHCRGWTSVFCDPLRPAFLGSATTNLNDTLVQNTRWNSGMLGIGLSRFCPLVYGSLRMSVLVSMCYAYFAFQSLYFFPLWCLATIPQLCLLNGIPMYPKASTPWFMIYSFLFLSSIFKHLEEVLSTGGSIQTWLNEQRIWMIKSITSYFYGTLDAILKLVGMREAKFMPTNKVDDDEQIKLYQRGTFDFQTSTVLLAPLVTFVILNLVSFVGGIARAIIAGGMEELFGQIFLSFFILIVNYPIIDGMIVRKDKGRVPPSVTLLCVVISMIFLALGSIVLMF